MKTLYHQDKFRDTYDALEKIFNNTYNGIAILTLDGHWIKVNDSICDLFGYTRHELFFMNSKIFSINNIFNIHIKKFMSSMIN